MNLPLFQLKKIFAELLNDPIFYVFFILIIVIFFASFIFYFFFLKDTPEQNEYAEYIRATVPPLLVSIGIFGTFLGILMALQHFNVSDKLGSIEDVIDKLKLAFGTSVAGLLSSLLLRVFFMIFRRKATQDATVSSLLNKMTEVKDAISGEEGPSILTQLKELQKSFDGMKDKMIENASDALLPALNKFAESFNAVINDNLSKTFKSLESSVQDLIKWQENYKEHLEKFETHINTLLNSLDESAKHLQSIVNSTEKLPDQIATLKDIGNQINEQMGSVNETFEAFSKMKDDASQAIPEIKSQLEKTTTLFEKQASSVDGVVKQLEKSEQNVSNIIETSKEGIKGMIEEFTTSMNTHTEKLGQNVQAQIGEMKEQYQELAKENKAEMKQFHASIDKEFKRIEGEVETIMKDVLTQMGNSLVSLSDKFVKDYTPLTTELQRLVDVSRTLQNKQNPPTQ